MKILAKEVLAKLDSEIGEEEELSSDVCKLLVCVVAPRFSLEIDSTKINILKGEELLKLILVLIMISLVLVLVLQFY